MPLQITNPLRERLVEQLRENLEATTVLANCVVSRWSLRGLSSIRSLPDKGKLAEELSRFIGDDPFATFVIDELSAGFVGSVPDPEAKEKALATFEGYEDLGAVASSLVDTFTTLPWPYFLTIRLPSNFGGPLIKKLGDYDLSPRHRIVSGATLRSDFPRAEARIGLLGVIARRMTAEWDDESAYLQVSTEGYYRTTQTEPFLSVRDDVFTFFGLGVALRLFGESQLPIPDAKGKVTNFHAHCRKKEAWVEESSPEIEAHYQEGIARLSLIDSDAEAMDRTLQRIGLVLESGEGRNLALSARWLFNSICGRDALLQYIQAAVAIEILLGDEEADPNIGLATLMANRFAYSIARTPTARTNLLKTFKDIYKVRSKIVHRGKSRLNADEQRLFQTLKSLLRLVIDNEQRLLERAEEMRRKQLEAT